MLSGKLIHVVRGGFGGGGGGGDSYQTIMDLISLLNSIPGGPHGGNIDPVPPFLHVGMPEMMEGI